MSPQSRNGEIEVDVSTLDRLWTFDLLSFRGIPIRVHFSYFLLLQLEAFAALFSFSNFKFTLFVFVLYGPVLFAILLMHEVGRALATIRLGGQIESIVVWPLGGFSVCGPTKGGPGDDLCIALAGPVTHILQAGLWLALYSITTEGDFSSWTDAVDIPQLSNGGFFTFLSLLSAQAAIINVVLLVINLFVPAYPLDGGRILSSLLVMAHFKVPVAAKATGFLGLTIGIALLVQGIVYFFIMPVGASYGILLAIVAGFAINSSTVLLRLTFHGLVHEHPLFSRQCYAEVFSEVRTDASLPMDMNELELT